MRAKTSGAVAWSGRRNGASREREKKMVVEQPAGREEEEVRRERGGGRLEQNDGAVRRTEGRRGQCSKGYMRYVHMHPKR